MLKFKQDLAEMSRSNKQELENRLVQALAHCLRMKSPKIPAAIHRENGRGWQDSIDERQRRLLRLVAQHGSLKPQLLDMDLANAYRNALKILALEYPPV